METVWLTVTKFLPLLTVTKFLQLTVTKFLPPH